MRFADLLGLALSALWQQKVRTLLTTLGVVFGTFVLTASLSIRGGVQDTIRREYGRFGELRRVEASPTFVSMSGGPTPEELAIPGTVSEARRRRLQEEIRNHWEGPSERRLKAPLTPERVAQIAKMEHVVSVRPFFVAPATAQLGDRAGYAEILPVPPGTEKLTQRLVAGADFSSANAREVLVTEYLFFKLGVIEDAAVEAAVGKTLRLEFRSGSDGVRPHAALAVLLGGAGKLGPRDEQALARLAERLPEALSTLDLSKEEKAALQKLQEARKPVKPAKEVVTAEDFTIRGVLRASDAEMPHRRHEWAYHHASVFLPSGAGEALWFRLPEGRKDGLGEVFVEVDDAEHVKAVSEDLRAMGLQVRSLAEFAEREQLTYLLIFTAMTLVAAVALLVAALGIVNTMKMSVLERVREIGVMKAVGARDGHIQLIFLIEGALIGLAGGLLGLGLGYLASFPGDAWARGQVEAQFKVKLQDSLFIFPWWLVAWVLLSALLVTTLAAFYPARRAARVNPITALRHE